MKTPAPPPAPCLYFQVHQPYRLAEYDFFQVGERGYYENDGLNEMVFSKVAEKCYLPATKLFRELIEKTEGRFRFALSLTGVVMEQMEDYRPDVLEAFRDLVATGSVEILGETYYHSLTSLYSSQEFTRQVALHRTKVREVFGVEPQVFRNTELVYSNRIATAAEEMGFRGILAEGVPWVWPDSSVNYLAQAPGVKGIKTLLRNSMLSDDLAFRFSDETWSEYPLTATRYCELLHGFTGQVLNIFMDFEAIGEHQWRESGIFRFWEEFAPLVLERGGEFLTPGEAVARFDADSEYDCVSPTSWADSERDPSAWTGNVMQQEASLKVHGIEQGVLETGDARLLHSWSKLQSSDHFHYMSTKEGPDGMVHRYFSPYDTPYDAYIYFMNALADLQIRVDRINTLRAVSPLEIPESYATRALATSSVLP
ncbi:MAG: glycoside hydrolase family 57 protein [Roseibacillus sp.]|jgi:alpha-amylase